MITLTPTTMVVGWLLGFCYLALIPWPKETFRDRLAQGIIVPTVALVVGLVVDAI